MPLTLTETTISDLMARRVPPLRSSSTTQSLRAEESNAKEAKEAKTEWLAAAEVAAGSKGWHARV